MGDPTRSQRPEKSKSADTKVGAPAGESVRPARAPLVPPPIDVSFESPVADSGNLHYAKIPTSKRKARLREQSIGFKLIAFGVVCGVAAAISMLGHGRFGSNSDSRDTEARTAAEPEIRASGQMGAETANNVDPEVSSYQQLRRIADADRSFVKSELVDQWVPQISSKRPGIFDDGVLWDNARTLTEFLDNREKYGAKLLWSGDWSTFSAPNFWVTIVPATFSHSDGALEWCTAQGFDSWHCLAKLVSTSHPIAGSTATNDG